MRKTQTQDQPTLLDVKPEAPKQRNRKATTEVAVHKAAPAPAALHPSAMDPQVLMQTVAAAAANPNVDVEKFERLTALLERVTANAAKAAFDADLALMQEHLPTIDKKGKIEIREKDRATNERTGRIQQSTKYARWEDINEAIRPILGQFGFALTFKIGMTADNKIQVTGILSHRQGHREETTLVLPHDATGSKNAVQAIGSSTSYGKRYCAQALLNITSRGEDDDAQSLTDPVQKITAAQVEEIAKAMEVREVPLNAFLEWCGIEKIADLPATAFIGAINGIKNYHRKDNAKTSNR